jgi:hypothetical protein
MGAWFRAQPVLKPNPSTKIAAHTIVSRTEKRILNAFIFRIVILEPANLGKLEAEESEWGFSK